MTLDNYPTTGPSLILDFVNSGQIDPNVAFQRDSIGTYQSKNTNIKTARSGSPRFEWVNGVCQGLLIEEARTNILLQSTDFTTYWNKFNVTIDPNVETSPDGTTTASKMQWSSSSGRNCVFVQPITDVTQTYTCSFYAKADEWNFAAVAMQTPGGTSPRYWITVDLTTGDVEEYSSGALTQTSYQVTPLANGWWRVSATANVNNAGKVQVQMEVGMSPNNTFGGSVSGTPDNSGIYIWGAQEEQSAFLTSYIPTNGATVTRAADVATMPADYNVNEFTIINQDFGVVGAGDSLTIVGNGEIAKRTAVYSSHLTQEQANTLAGKDDEWWEWRVVGSPFGWRKRMTNGSIQVDWGDGSPIEGLPIDSSHDFIDGAGYHTVRLKLGTSPYIGFDYNTADFKLQVVSIGPIPASMPVMAYNIFNGYTNLKTVDFAGASFMSTSDYGNKGFDGMFQDCSNLLSVPDIEPDSSVTRAGGMFGGCSSLTRLPFFDTSNITTFNAFAQNCSNIKEVPLYDTSSAGNMASAFFSCTKLTSFPLLDTSGVTNFNQTWYNCVRLASFPKIDTSSGNDFYRAWVICTSLVSFPELDFSSGTTFREAWYQDSALTDFPANMFNTTGTLAANAFQNAWRNCALTAQSIENILVSLDSNGATGIQLGIQGGSNAAKSTWSTAANNAYNNLVTKSWSISFNP